MDKWLWFHKHENLLSLAAWLIETDMLTTPEDVLYFFEKPWKWEDEWFKLEIMLVTRQSIEEQHGQQ